MSHIKTLNTCTCKETAAKGGCGECQTSCQSACKTSCTVANQKCEHEKQVGFDRIHRLGTDTRQSRNFFIGVI